MTDRLSIYNGALRILGERKLASLTEDREPRRLLDDVWDDDGVKACLDAAQWNWASRMVALSYEPAVVPTFGYLYAFSKPTDMVRLLGLSADERVQVPLLKYESGAGYFFADLETIYVRYVSNDAAYGGDFSNWPESFADFVHAHFAREIAPKLTASESKVQSIQQERKNRLSEAASIDAMSGPSKSPPMGNWANARLAGRTGSRRREFW